MNGTLKILFADDDPDNREQVYWALTSAKIDYVGTTVQDKSKLIKTLESEIPDVMIINHNDVAFDIIETCRAIKEIAPNIPTIVISEILDAPSAVYLIKEGVSDVIAKASIEHMPGKVLQAIIEKEKIIDQDLAKRALRNSETMLKKAQKIAHVGSWDLNLSTGVTTLSDEACRIFGLATSDNEQSYEAWLSFIYPDDFEAVIEKSRQAKQSLSESAFNYRILLKDGSIKYIYSETEYELDDEGTPISLFGVVHDVTKQLLTESELQKSELSYKRLLDNMNDGFLVDDVDGNLVFANEQFCKIFGIEKQELNTKVLEDYIAPEERETLRKRHNDRIKGKPVPEKFEYRGLQNNGERIWVEVNVKQIEENGSITGTQSVVRDITERKNTEENIKKANRMYAFISQINQTIVHATNEQSLFDEACRIAVETGGFELACIDRIDAANRKLILVAHNNVPLSDLEQLNGLEFKETGAIGKMLKYGECYVINDYDQEPEQNFWTKYAFARAFQSAIFLPIKKLGNIHYVLSLFSTNANMFDKKEIVLLTETSGDISFALDVFEKEKQRIHFENKLIDSERRLNQAQTVAHLGSWELDFSTNLATWSDEACRIYGLDITDNIQDYDKWLSYIHPDDKGRVLRVIEKGQNSLTGFSLHHRIITQKDEIKHIFFQAHFDLDNHGVPFRMHGVAHDVTEIQEAENALRQSKTNLRLIVDLIPHSIFAMDGAGKFIFANKSFTQLYGLTPQQLVGKTIYETIPNNNNAAELVKEAIEVMNSGKRKIIPESTFTDHAGKERVFYSIKVPYNPVGQQVKAMLGIALDVTEQKAAETERMKMVADIMQRNNDLLQFSYIVSHNLRSPVANIMGLTDLLQSTEHDRDEEQVFIKGLSTSAKKLDDVIRDLNTVLQIRSKINERKEMVNLNKVCRDIQSDMSGLVENENVDITTDFTEIDTLYSIKSYLYSIILNMVSNSIKFRQPDIVPAILIKTHKVENGTQLIYSDNSIGIDSDKYGTKIFGLYNRFHDNIEGKGVGLFMAKTQVEALGGSIHVKSKEKAGVTFTILFTNS